MERETHDDGGLLELPWVPVCVGGSQLLAKSRFRNTAYRLLLTDTHSVWEEELDGTAIQDRAQELNKRLSAPVHAFFSHLCEMVRPSFGGGAGVGDESGAARAQLHLTHRGGGLLMKLKSELAGMPFYWEFRCTPVPVTLVCDQLVRPLLLMSRVLQQQVEQLGGLLARKDAEIQDYRENGALLSRERLQTEMFEEQSFRENFMTQALPRLCVRQDGGLGFNPELRELYTAVTARGDGSVRKRGRSDIQDPPPGEDAPAHGRAPDPTPTCTQPPGADLSREPGAERENRPGHGENRPGHGENRPGHGENRPGQGENRPGTREPDRPREEQTSPRRAAALDPPSSRPRKKKAVGLFR